MQSNGGAVFGKVFSMRIVKYETGFKTCSGRREMRMVSTAMDSYRDRSTGFKLSIF